MISALAARIGAWQKVSVHRRVFSAAAVVAVFTFASKVAGAAREVVVAHQFGTSSDVDAFLLAFLMPGLAITVLGATLNSALIPTYVEVREREGHEAAQELLSTTLVVSLVLLSITACAMTALVPYAAPLFSGKATPERLELTKRLAYILTPSLVVTGTTMTWTAVLNAHQRFAPAAAATLVVPLVAIAALFAFGRAAGIRALAWGTLVGFLVEAAIVGWTLRREGVSLVPRWHGLTPAVRRVIGQYLPMVAGMVAMGTNGPIDQIMAARLGPGSVAALGYGTKIEAFVVGVGVTSIGAAVLPHFSRLAATEDWLALRSTIRRYATVLVLLALPVAIGLIVLSEPIVRVLFQRGAFTPEDTRLVARIQSFLLLALPVKFAGLLFIRFIMAVKANVVLMWTSILNALVNVAGNYVLSRHLGVAGIALSTTVVVVVSVSISMTFTFRRLHHLCAAGPVAKPAAV